MNVLDTIAAEQVEEGDLIALSYEDSEGNAIHDILHVTGVRDGGDIIVIHGNSLLTGDSQSVMVSPDHNIDILGA